jgi:PAS domain S-box-containing protein
LQPDRTRQKAKRATSAPSALRPWRLLRNKRVYQIILGVGAIVSTAGVCISIVQAVNRDLAPATALLAIGLICLVAVTAIHRGRTRDRIETLQHDIRDKDGYRHFVDHAAEGFFRTAPGGEMIEINAALAHIYGYSSQQALCDALTERPQDFYIDLTHREEFWSQLHAQGRVDDFVSKVRRADGKAIWITENARAVHDPDGRLLYCEGTVQDVTVQRASLQATRKALQDVREAARAKAAFIAVMSHELKTPLNAVLGFSELMLQQLCGPINERYRSYLADIHSNGKRLLVLITDVIDFARIAGDALELSESVFPIDSIIQAARDNVLQDRTDAPAIVIQIPQQSLMVRGDSKRISQVITNLLSNAVKFTPADGTIAVRAYRGRDGSLLIEVADTGIGMAPDRIQTALEPFRQIDEGVARRYEGLGLGLPLAHELIRLHGGRLAITSTVGEGTTVNIALPPNRVIVGPTAGQREEANIGGVA